ncbi:MAG: ABC transporter permease [Gemmatimonadetes bacterium]|nr:ABC transporter permease [Gemmatimonadota bacterium]
MKRPTVPIRSAWNRFAFRILQSWMRVVVRAVPRSMRTQWAEEWEGETWHGIVVSDRRVQLRRVVNLGAGMLRDAIDLRRPPARRKRKTSGDSMFRQMLADLRFGMRQFRKAPLFTAVVVGTLAIGIGASTAIFTVVNSLLLNPLGYADAGRLVILWQGRHALEIEKDWFSTAQFVDIRDGTDVFEDLSLSIGGSITLMNRGAPTEIGYVRATSSFLSMLGVTPALGRLFDASDDAAGAPTVALLSHGLWQRSFGGDPAVVGETVTLNQTTFDIVGVLPADFQLDNEVLPVMGGGGQLEVVLSHPLSEERLSERGSEDHNIVGKLKPGVTIGQAQSQLDGVAQTIIEQHEQNAETGFFIRVVPLLEEVVGSVRRPLVALLGAVGVLLLIACANVANLLLSRSDGRQRELTIRSALGAGRARILRQLLTESVFLAGAGGALGVGLAFASLAALQKVGARSLPRLPEIGIDGTVLGFALLLAITTSVVFGLLPALRTSRVDLAGNLRATGRETLGRGGLWSTFNLSSALVVGEIGLAVVLLIDGGLLVRSFRALERVDPGFVATNVWTFKFQLLGERFGEPAERSAAFNEIEDQLAALPGVTDVGGVHILPFTGGVSWGPLTFEGMSPGDEVITHFRIATPGHFRTLQIPLIRGRLFDERDRADVPPVALVDQRLAERVFPGEDPIGRRVESWPSGWAEIVGIVGSVKGRGLDAESPLMLYFPHQQVPTTRMYLNLRAPGVSNAFGATVERVMRESGAPVLLADATPMTRRVADSLASRRFTMLLFQAFGLMALVLAVVGVYGLVAYRVSQGTPELGMRMALGADAGHVARLVLRHGMALSTLGIVLGLGAAAVVTRLMGSMLFNVAPIDPTTFGIVAVFLITVTLVACFVPARRATRLDPMEALRSD